MVVEEQLGAHVDLLRHLSSMALELSKVRQRSRDLASAAKGFTSLVERYQQFTTQYGDGFAHLSTLVAEGGPEISRENREYKDLVRELKVLARTDEQLQGLVRYYRTSLASFNW
jgi:hypothetical protein